jgi:septal ring factor EnvC (AmiA/AmiB activator)
MSVDQPQLELQLKVWKELAISKQMLMRSAAEALKLDPNCSPDELRQALDGALKKVADAEVAVAKTQSETRQSIAALEQKLAAAERAQAAAQATATELTAAQEKSAQAMSEERGSFVKESQKLKDRAADAEKALKAVNTALADTPENVLKKMKALRKEKQDEADSKRVIETALNTARKEKRDQDQLLKDLKDNVAKLITQHRDLHALGLKLREQLEPLAKNDKDVPAVPDLDASLLEDIENPSAAKDKKENGNGNGKDKPNGKPGKK